MAAGTVRTSSPPDVGRQWRYDCAEFAERATPSGALYALGLLDSGPDPAFDEVTRLAPRRFRTEAALVSLVDSERRWFTSRQGVTATETPHNQAFCGHAIADDDLFCVSNALDDPRFRDNLVTDEQTGLHNRRGLEAAGSPAARPGRPLRRTGGVVYADIVARVGGGVRCALARGIGRRYPRSHGPVGRRRRCAQPTAPVRSTRLAQRRLVERTPGESLEHCIERADRAMYLREPA